MWDIYSSRQKHSDDRKVKCGRISHFLVWFKKLDIILAKDPTLSKEKQYMDGCSTVVL